MIAPSRRAAIQFGFATLAAGALPMAARAQSAAASRIELTVGPWRRFEVTTQVSLADGDGLSQLWLPVPGVNSDYQRSLDSRWTGNAEMVRLVADARTGAPMIHARFADGTSAPTLTLVSTVETRNRAIDWSRPGRPNEDPAVLKRYLAPTNLHPVDGLVLDTARAAAGGTRTDLDKVRGVYKWLTHNCFRDLSVAGCGKGAIGQMLETGNLGGKCADLSALFVAMNRSLGVPAREVYGLRLAPSAFGYKQLGGDSANLTGAQHCRAEVWLSDYGWVAMDPADVLKVMRQEKAEWIKDLDDPLIAPVNKALFGAWEGNWVAWNTANDLVLPGAEGEPLPFLMYPQGRNSAGRLDDLDPKTFRYAISAREVTA
jgi:transglutaminase-like putative cysteine protease